MHKDLSVALTVLKQYTCINSFKNMIKPDINYWKQCRSRWSQLIRIHTVLYTTCEFIIITKYEIQYCKFILTCPRKFLTYPEWNGIRSDKLGTLFLQSNIWVLKLCWHSFRKKLSGTFIYTEKKWKRYTTIIYIIYSFLCMLLLMMSIFETA